MESLHSDTSGGSEDSHKDDAYSSKYHHHEYIFSPIANLLHPTRNLNEHIHWQTEHTSSFHSHNSISIHDPFDTGLRICFHTTCPENHWPSEWNNRTTKSWGWPCFVSNLNGHSRGDRGEKEA